MERTMDNKACDPEDDRDSGVWGKMKRIAGQVTIEPSILFHVTAYYSGGLILSNLIIYKACHVNLSYNHSYCEALVDMRGGDDKSDIEKKAQEIVAGTEIWSSVIDNFFPIIYLLFFGAWSDTFGRKLPYLLTMFSYSATYAILMLSYYTSWNTQVVALLSSLIPAVTGGRTAITMIIFSYISDTTTIRNRTLRIGLASAVDTLGNSLGSGMGGQIAAAGLGYYWGFGIAAILQLVGVIWAWVAMKETRDPEVAQKDSNYRQFVAIFDLRHVRDSFRTFFRKRPNGDRARLFLLVTAFLSASLPVQPEGGILYNFSRIQLGWDVGKFGIFSSVRVVMDFIGGLLSVGILSRWMGVSDAFIGILASISQMSSSSLYAFVTEDWMMYLALVMDMLTGSMQIVARSMISKIIPCDETGKVFSFLGVLTKVARLPVTPVYNVIYRETLDTFPGAIFVLSTAVTIPAIVAFIFLAFCKRDREEMSALNKSFT